MEWRKRLLAQFYVTVRETQREEEGSIEMDEELMRSSGLSPTDAVEAVNLKSGVVFSAYITPARLNAGEVRLKGGCAALLGEVGDVLELNVFVWSRDPVEPRFFTLRRQGSAEVASLVMDSSGLDKAYADAGGKS